MTAIECFDTSLPAKLAANQQKAIKLDTVVRVTATGDGGGDWTVTLKAPTASCRPHQPSDDTAVQATVRIAASDVPAMLSGPTQMAALVTAGKVTFSGPKPADAALLACALRYMQGA